MVTDFYCCRPQTQTWPPVAAQPRTPLRFQVASRATHIRLFLTTLSPQFYLSSLCSHPSIFSFISPPVACFFQWHQESLSTWDHLRSGLRNAMLCSSITAPGGSSRAWGLHPSQAWSSQARSLSGPYDTNLVFVLVLLLTHLTRVAPVSGSLLPRASSPRQDSSSLQLLPILGAVRACLALDWRCSQAHFFPGVLAY